MVLVKASIYSVTGLWVNQILTRMCRMSYYGLQIKFQRILGQFVLYCKGETILNPGN